MNKKELIKKAIKGGLENRLLSEIKESLTGGAGTSIDEAIQDSQNEGPPVDEINDDSVSISNILKPFREAGKTTAKTYRDVAKGPAEQAAKEVAKLQEEPAAKAILAAGKDLAGDIANNPPAPDTAPPPAPDTAPETGAPADAKDTWSQIRDQIKNPPMPTSNPIYNALILGLAGALGGGAIGGVTGSDRKTAIRNAIIGALLGTALGGSAGYFLS